MVLSGGNDKWADKQTDKVEKSNRIHLPQIFEVSAIDFDQKEQDSARLPSPAFSAVPRPWNKQAVEKSAVVTVDGNPLHDFCWLSSEWPTAFIDFPLSSCA